MGKSDRPSQINDRPRSQIRDVAPEGGDDVKHITPSGNLIHAEAKTCFAKFPANIAHMCFIYKRTRDLCDVVEWTRGGVEFG
jgi:hypothetical protein